MIVLTANYVLHIINKLINGFIWYIIILIYNIKTKKYKNKVLLSTELIVQMDFKRQFSM